MDIILNCNIEITPNTFSILKTGPSLIYSQLYAMFFFQLYHKLGLVERAAETLHVAFDVCPLVEDSEGLFILLILV